MSTKVILQHYLETYETSGNTLIDIDFGNLSFLQEKEAIYNMAGQKVSKSYYDITGREAIRITYERVFGDHLYNEINYPDVFLGLQKTIHYMDLVGEIAYSKKKQFYNFDLQPVFLADGTETVVGFSSQKQRQFLKSERLSADDYLQAKNPHLYAVLFSTYQESYNGYLRTGASAEFVKAMNSETNPDVLELLNKEVFGYEPMTFKELIILNLQ